MPRLDRGIQRRSDAEQCLVCPVKLGNDGAWVGMAKHIFHPQNPSKCLETILRWISFEPP